MLRSRVISGIDTARLSEAVSRPGIDPRIWISYAVLDSDPVVVTDAGDEDVIADVILLPSGTLETARVSAVYAGNGFGLYAPLKKDDEVLVVAPSGNPDQGLVITQRLWSPADKPPAGLGDNIEDVTLVVESGKNLRIKTQGSGNVYVTAAGGKVILGEETATRGVARIDDATVNGSLSIVAVPPVPPSPLAALVFTYTPPGGAPQVQTVTFAALAAPTTPPTPLPFDLAGKISTASDKVVSI